jgi:O-antigen/teichoic acid export membrane protein
VLAVSGRVLIPFVYGKAFLGSLDAFLWLLPGITTYSLYTVLAAHIAGTGRPRLMLWISCVALVVTLVLTLALIPRIGIRGAAIASTVSYTTSAALGTLVFVRLTRLSPRLLFIPTRDDFALAGKALARLRSLPGGLPRARP